MIGLLHRDLGLESTQEVAGGKPEIREGHQVILCLAIGDLALTNESGERRRALAVSTAVRNIPLAFVIANASFPGTLVAPVTLVFATFSMLLSVVYAKIMLRNAPARSPA